MRAIQLALDSVAPGPTVDQRLAPSPDLALGQDLLLKKKHACVIEPNAIPPSGVEIANISSASELNIKQKVALTNEQQQILLLAMHGRSLFFTGSAGKNNLEHYAL